MAGKAQGLEEGKAVGREQEWNRWHDWNSRRTAAEAEERSLKSLPLPYRGFLHSTGFRVLPIGTT